MCTNLRLCDNCKNRNIQCCICTDNNWYREGKFSHDEWVRNKVIDEVFEFLKSKRDKKTMRVNLDDLEIKEYKKQLEEQLKEE